MPQPRTASDTQSSAKGAGSRGPYRTGLRRREQLITQAMEVFAEHGYAGGSIRSIAERAGVSHATLIQHFGSKEGLLTAVLAEWDRRTARNGLADARGLDYIRQLPETTSGYRQHRGLLELFVTLTAEATDPAHPAHAFILERYSRNLETLTSHLHEAMADGEIAPMTPQQIEVECRLLTAALDGIGLQWLLDDSTDVETAARICVERALTAWTAPVS